MPDNTVTVAIIGLLSGTLGALIAGWFAYRKTEADAEKSEAEANEIIRNTVMGLIEPLNKRIKELQDEINGLRGEVDKMSRRNKSLWRYIEKLLDVIRKLTQQLKDNNMIPCAEPPDWVDDGQD